MDRPRPCSCKGIRTCLICEKYYGISKNDFLSTVKNNPTYVYCPLCNKAWPGWDMNDYKAHPDHVGSSIDFQGVFIQNYGPKCNFKKKRLAPGDFKGFPEFSKFVQDKFKNVDILENYQTIEQCSLEYDPSRGASIDPHIDDCWVWGERIVTVNLLEDSVLTMTRFSGELTRYNLLDVSTYPPVLDEKGHLIERPLSIDAYETTCSKTMAATHQHCLAPYSNVSPNINRDFVDKFDDCSDSEKADIVVRIPMPKRSLLVLYGQARYSWEHSVFREDIPSRRVCLAYREFTPPFLKGGRCADKGLDILERSKEFWGHEPIINTQ
ncbi:unnamed protein product [Timema podura]|uniref:Isopenicillin N synthase-like Fe(2+) 2OG dioxygenase domain-containing protein n=1 Tax=Timema podura TaxID=61482 RepID=A0ABN7NGJ9_TIMPD|nr:unnamed protein product [Timema podura]